MRQSLTLLPLVFAAACSSGPVSFSQPVGIELKAKSSDVANNVIAENKDINTESGNPFGAFVTAARGDLGNHDPSRVELPTLTLTLGAQSTGVTKLDDIFTGEVDISFLMDTSNNTYPVGSITNPTGVGPDSMDSTFVSTQMSSADYQLFLGGQFKVVIRGTAAAGFATKGADATLQTTFTFDAFQ